MALRKSEEKNEALLAKIAMLEQQVVQKEKDHGEHVKQSARLEELLSKTLSRVDQLETSLEKRAPENRETEKVTASSSKGDQKTQQPPKSQSGSAGKDDQSGDESDSGDDDDESCMYTPAGVKVLWIQFVLYPLAVK